MPELPEVETTVRAISKFQNKILKEIIVHNADLRWKVDKNISQLSKNKLIKTHPNVQSAKVIPPPVKPKSFTKKEIPYFIFASGPRTRKQIQERGVYLLMDAMRIIQDANENIELRFVGRWQEGTKILDQIIEKRKLKNVVMSNNHINNMDSLIGESSGLIIPYIGESIGDIPLSALESLAFGTPVITTHEFHVITDDEEPAIRICDQNAEKLAKTMIEVSKLGDISQLCKNVVRNCNIEQFVKSYESIYREYGN